MSNIIRLLPDHVANQIAAGEVVQRPASVVKELIENAVDAEATEIKLVLKEAGKTLIQVIDNGKGMNETDARMAFERHATSKISKAEDLFALNTKGFRGEALASIAAIAHVDLKTCLHNSELGTHLVIEGSKVMAQEVAVTPPGTVFSVKNLFFNIPARRNFLKSDNVELRNIVDEFERITLVHPGISFTMIHNGSEVFNLPSSNLRQRIVNVFGTRTNEKLVPIEEITEIVTIRGFIGKPEFAKKSRGEQFFFVNDRFIRSGYLHHSVLAAYEGLLKDGTQPTYFIYLSVPPDSIDINIHPTKTEIKFDDEQALYSILRSSIKHSLGQFNVAPVLDFHRDEGLDVPYEFKDREAETPLIEIDTHYNPFSNELLNPEEEIFNPFKQTPANTTNGLPSDFVARGFNPFEESSFLRKEEEPEEPIAPDEEEEAEVFESKLTTAKSTIDFSSFKQEGRKADEAVFFASKSNKTEIKKSSATEVGAWQEVFEGLKGKGSDIDISGLTFEEEEVTGSLFDESTETTLASRTFQIQRKYIVSPIKSGMVVINQGRAHQRILYEKFIGNIAKSNAVSQQLLFPLTLYYAPYEVVLLKEIRHSLKQMGFDFEDMGEDHVILSGLPVNVAESEAQIVLDDLIMSFQEGIPETNYIQTERIAKTLAQSLAVKSGTILNETEQEDIVNSLFGCKEPNISPFMKPTFITMKVEDIERKFIL
ncbi:DNA mismatch repair endonuclease MutL [Myroides odoratus]|uniref:DNA mismatch repair protein MutL n=1 Tax=Myroides odoratus TaxID=256 RepID=A0A9Q6Z6C6_MYROD|nr:DNA mismatch repair endonuclease MutL [Myroides odoratus]EHQ43339.1 DNA mismatch repair protein MutL [Myroides odoratus DSM 2801]EKB06726.1 DNA mismatch repair protein mutL [Myroides odoratus CIP 103059]QQU00682.1 DNA mismatch repair endonuclease MutL [Myroides odoratus]WQD57084.1 DNA mismatch repair endonuclease MutL [Myroides odoratus]STZ30616.1 DNA mismatch repair protein mutL [Myroides odoratus]